MLPVVPGVVVRNVHAWYPLDPLGSNAVPVFRLDYSMNEREKSKDR